MKLQFQDNFIHIISLKIGGKSHFQTRQSSNRPGPSPLTNGNWNSWIGSSKIGWCLAPSPLTSFEVDLKILEVFADIFIRYFRMPPKLFKICFWASGGGSRRVTAGFTVDPSDGSLLWDDWSFALTWLVEARDSSGFPAILLGYRK